jgi:hypothetical protein
MQSRSLSRPVVWGIVILMSLAVFLPTQRLPAQTTGCIAVDRNDQPRSCTFVEEHGGCLWNALDSYYTCSENASDFWEHLACELGVQFDLLACNLGLPWRLLKSITT